MGSSPKIERRSWWQCALKGSIASSSDWQKQHPHCFRGVLNNPVQDDANKHARMTREKFEDGMRKVCKQNGGARGKVGLIVDNFFGHPNIPLSNITLFFLPPNTASITQPLDASRIRNLKYPYQTFLLKRLVATDGKEGLR